MSYLDVLIDRQIRAAMERGEFEIGSGKGQPLPDLDQQRAPGWWGQQLVERERSRVLHEETLAGLVSVRARFWRAASIEELRASVTEANRSIVAVNARMDEEDRIELFDVADLVAQWRKAAPR